MSIERIQQAVQSHRSATIKVGPHKVKLYCGKRKDRTRFTLCWYNGTQRERIETSDPDAILTAAEKVVGAFTKGANFAATISPERVQEFVEAETMLSGVNLMDLVKHYREFHSTRSTTVSQACAAFEESISNRSPRYTKTVTSQLDKFKTAFAGPLAMVSTADIDDYLKKIAHPKTRLNHRRTLSTLFKFGQRKGFLPSGLTAIDKTDRPHIPANDEPPTLTPEQLETLLTAAMEHDEKIASFLAIGAFAGCRSAEIQRLTWGDVLKDVIVLGSSKTKTRRRRIVEMSPNLEAWMTRLRKENDVWVTYPEDTGSLFYKKLARVCQKAGVAWQHNCLRHTFVSSHLELHRDPPRTAKTSGHSLAVLETSYLKLITHDRAKAWFEIMPTTAPENENTENIEKEADHA